MNDSDRRYRDRHEAGVVLAQEVSRYAANASDEEKLIRPVVLGLPRGGLPVAEVIADELHAPLDALIVRKLGVPRQPELAMGALASVGDAVVRVDNPEVLEYVRSRGIGASEIDQVEAAEMAELRRRQASYRQGRAELELAERTVVIVDDGLATGATVLAAVGAVRGAQASRVIVALPVIVGDPPRALAEAADAVICPWVAPDLHSVGAAYKQFDQTTDDEVRQILHRFSSDS